MGEEHKGPMFTSDDHLQFYLKSNSSCETDPYVPVLMSTAELIHNDVRPKSASALPLPTQLMPLIACLTLISRGHWLPHYWLGWTASLWMGWDSSELAPISQRSRQWEDICFFFFPSLVYTWLRVPVLTVLLWMGFTQGNDSSLLRCSNTVVCLSSYYSYFFCKREGPLDNKYLAGIIACHRKCCVGR